MINISWTGPITLQTLCISSQPQPVPLKELRQERNEWFWAEPKETDFQILKKVLSSPKVFAQYSNLADTKVPA